MVIMKSSSTSTSHCFVDESFSMYLKSKVEHLVDHLQWLSFWCGMILALCIIMVYIFNFASLTMIYCFLVFLLPCNKYWHPCQFSNLYSVHHVCWSCQTHNFVPSFFTNINPLNSDKFALGSKWNSTSQCVYMRLRTIVLLKTSFC